MVTSRTRRRIARFLVAVLLYGQAAIAFAACESLRPAAAQAIAETAMTCHEPEQNTNLCVSHCLAADQSLDKPSLDVPAVLLPPLPAFVPLSASVTRLLASQMWAPVTGPPLRILFRTLLI